MKLRAAVILVSLVGGFLWLPAHDVSPSTIIFSLVLGVIIFSPFISAITLRGKLMAISREYARKY